MHGREPAVLSCAENNIGSEGMQALAPELGKLTSLNELYLQGTACRGCTVRTPQLIHAWA